jgi:hypothetical protein
MNYKTLIAFLGKNQMKDWATPKSDWILAQGPDSKEWSEEFRKLKSLKKQEQTSAKYVCYLGRHTIVVGASYGSFTFDTGFNTYYNPDKDIILFYSLHEEYLLKDNNLDIDSVLEFTGKHDFDAEDSTLDYADIK